MRTLADAELVLELTERMAGFIRSTMAQHSSTAWAVVGLRRRGDLLARRLAQRLPGVAVGSLDITLYRDDLSEIGAQPVVRTSDIPFAIDGMQVVLIDDVLMTGRTIRAALESLKDLGRPARVWLAVLVDRGGRELPIEPNFAALQLTDGELSGGERVEVRLTPLDPEDAIVVWEAST